MRIHTDTLTLTDLHAAARTAGVGVYRDARHGSRKRDHAFDVILEGTGRTGTRYGQNNDMIAATWDEWGIFLAELFEADPSVTIPRIYEDAEAFHWQTADRFRTLTPAGQHVRHRWDYTGTPYENTCRKCGAVQRWAPRPARTVFDREALVAPRRAAAPPSFTFTASGSEDLGKYASHGRYEADLLGRIDELVD